MTKEMGNEEERGRKGAGHGRRSVCVGGGIETEREREKDVISCATEPHSRHGRNSR